MATTLDRPRDAVLQRSEPGSLGRRRRFSLVSLSIVLILVHTVDAWLLQVEGETSLGHRSLLLGVVAVAGVSVWASARSLSRRALAAGQIGIGVVSLVVLAPITLSYIDKQGLGGSRYTGVLGVAAALLQLGIGTVRSIRLTRSRWRRWLAVPIGLFVLQFFVLPATLAVYATHAARPQLGTRTPSDVGLSYVTVRFPARDGVMLAAWYVPSRNGAAIILRHGSGSTRMNLLDHAAFLAEAGYGVLLTDARGHGESGGRINELGWHGAEDIAAALDYLETRSDIDGGIGILGLSMGGEEALNAAALEERTAAVVAEGVGINNYNDSVANGGHAVARLVNWIEFAGVDLLSDAREPEGIEAAMAQIDPSQEILIIAGNPRIERVMAPIYARSGGPNVKIWELPDTGHAQGLAQEEAEYRLRVQRFFDAALKPTASSD